MVRQSLKAEQYRYSKIRPSHLKGNPNYSTLEDKYISWDDGDMTGARPIPKEACTLIKSFANPKKETGMSGQCTAWERQHKWLKRGRPYFLCKEKDMINFKISKGLHWFRQPRLDLSRESKLVNILAKWSSWIFGWMDRFSEIQHFPYFLETFPRNTLPFVPVSKISTKRP